MSAAEKLLSETIGDEKNDVLEVNVDTRAITIPKTVTNIGVESDEDVLRLNFRMQRFYHGADLMDFRKYINYKNAHGGGDVYAIRDEAIEGDYITFSWLVGRNASVFKGNVKFVLCFKKMSAENPSVVDYEFNSAVATLPVLEGLETSEEAVHSYTDILVQWESELFGIGDTQEQRLKNASVAEQKNLEAKGKEILDTFPPGYATVHLMMDESVAKYLEDNNLTYPTDEHIKHMVNVRVDETLITNEEIDSLNHSLVYVYDIAPDEIDDLMKWFFTDEEINAPIYGYESGFDEIDSLLYSMGCPIVNSVDKIDALINNFV